jgi:hypothetical protein
MPSIRFLATVATSLMLNCKFAIGHFSDASVHQYEPLDEADLSALLSNVVRDVNDTAHALLQQEMLLGWPTVDRNESLARTKDLMVVDNITAIAKRRGRDGFQQIVQPVSIVNFVMTDGTGRVSYDTIMKQIDQLNSAYSGQEARAGGYDKATDSKIRFKLAGVRYVVNNDYFNLCTLPTVAAQSRPKYMMAGDRHANVYVCWCANNLGMSWLPYDSWYHQLTGEDHYALGAVVHWQLLTGNTFNNGMWSKGNILTHEIGHFYGVRAKFDILQMLLD